jgi:histidyl-tRNA synthetase
VFAKDPKVLDSSLCAGGRYDEIIGKFLNSDQAIPAVGISFGLDTIYDALAARQTPLMSKTQVYLIPIKTLNVCIEITTQLRQRGIPSEVDLLNRNISRNLEYANRLQIPFVIIAGKRDLAQNTVTLKDMRKGTEKTVKLDKIYSHLTKLMKK